MNDIEEAISFIQSAEKYLRSIGESWFADHLDDAIDLLKGQKPKTGNWIEKEDYNQDTYYDCSACGESWMTIDGTPWQNGMNYCPHCGAKMEGL